MIERKNYATLTPPAGPYVHAVKHGGVLHVSGLTAFGSAAQGASMAAQAEAILRQLASIAAEEDTSLASRLKPCWPSTDEAIFRP